MSSQALRITLIRHGESVANHAQRWQGQGDSPLSERGVSQAAALGQRLQGLGGHAVRMLSSDLSRAVDTARAIGLPCEQRRELREFDVGRWEGLTREEVEARFPEEMARLKAGEDIALGGGETYSEFAERIEAAFARLRSEASAGEHLVVVCHGGVIGALIGGLLGFRAARRFPLARLSNTSLTELVFGPEGLVFRVFNDTHHLAHTPAWPEFADAVALVALTSGDEELPGTLSARYAVDALLPGLAPDTALEDRVATLQALHPDSRVALGAQREAGWAYLGTLLWPEGSPAPARLEVGRPLRGHVGFVHGRRTVLDFGLFDVR